MAADSPPPSVVAASLLLGAATGLRSQMGMAAVVVSPPRTGLPRLLRRRGVRPVVVLAAAGELIADKLPSTPPRTAPFGLAARVGLGALSCGVLASSAGQGVLVPAAIGAGTAAGAAFGGRAGRAALARRVPPIAAAIAEDLFAATLALTALRVAGRAGRRPRASHP